jgi:hypothetical protein
MDERVAKGAIDQARRMSKGILNGHRTPGIFKRQRWFACTGVILLDANLNVLKLREILRYRRQEVDFAFLNQHHDRHASDGFRHGSDAKDRVGLHRSAFLAVLIAERFEKDGFTIASYQQDRSGNCAFINIAWKNW